MSISEIVNSDAGLALVGSALGAVWTFFRSKDWYMQMRRRRYGRAIRAMEAGIDRTYRTYVRAIKRGRADGKLSAEEIDRAHQQARRFAIRYGRTTGVDVIQELGDDFIDLWMTKLVQRARRKAVR